MLSQHVTIPGPSFTQSYPNDVRITFGLGSSFLSHPNKKIQINITPPRKPDVYRKDDTMDEVLKFFEKRLSTSLKEKNSLQ